MSSILKIDNIRTCLLVSYGILFIYFIYLLSTLYPGYKMGKKEETIASYLGVIVVSLYILVLVIYIISELLEL